MKKIYHNIIFYCTGSVHLEATPKNFNDICKLIVQSVNAEDCGISNADISKILRLRRR